MYTGGRFQGKKAAHSCLKSFCGKMNELRSLKKVMMFGLPLMKLWVQHKVSGAAIFLGLLQQLLLVPLLSLKCMLGQENVQEMQLLKILVMKMTVINKKILLQLKWTRMNLNQLKQNLLMVLFK
jgi:hypothetical protein